MMIDKRDITNKLIVRQLINFAIKHRKITLKHLDETGVYHAQHRILMEVNRNPNVAQNELARMMDISAATVAVSLKKLEKEGYINKMMDEGDNRFNKITITEKGKQIVERSKQIFDEIDKKVFADFTDDEKYNLFILLEKLNDNLVSME